MNVLELPFFGRKPKYINPDINDDGVFSLPTKFVNNAVQTIKLICFNKETSECMEIVPFDTITQNDEMMTFKFVADNSEIDVWESKLLKRFHWSWFEKMREGLTSEWFKKLNKRLNNDEREKTKLKIWPEQTQVYEAFASSFSKVQVVIVGQSPYANDNSSGIAFASTKANKPFSLAQFEYALGGMDVSNDLSTWVKQGVLLLNVSLTVRDDKVEFDKEWEPFIKLVYQTLSTKQNLVWVFMGAAAKRTTKFVKNTDHTILTCEHPAAAAYDKSKRNWQHEDVFTNVNIALESKHIAPIKWSSR